MNAKQCIAMILAGGRGVRLGSLTRYYSKPAVHFGGNHRIIDFALSNCNHSEIETVGILSQYLSDSLRAYIDETHDIMPEHGDIYMLPPQSANKPYTGTADAVYKNIEFIERFDPENVLILSGDHIYNMDYNEMLAFHRETGADITVASTPVPINDAPRFGIINAEKSGRVHGFEEKPLRPKSCLASMGIYIFKWSALKRYLLMDSVSILTRHDFGGDILPKMLSMGEPIYTYKFDGYWRDVGTVASLWEANMDMLDDPSLCLLRDYEWEVQGSYMNNTPNYIAREAYVRKSVMAGECSILGTVKHSVLSDRVTVGQNAEITDSVIMPGACIGNNAKIYNAVIGTGAIILDNAVIGADDGTDFFVDHSICSRGVSLVSPWACVAEDMRLQSGSHIHDELLTKIVPGMDTEIAPNRHHGQVVYPVYNKRYKSLVV